jgi:hypothetical protein
MDWSTVRKALCILMVPVLLVCCRGSKTMLASRVLEEIVQFKRQIDVVGVTLFSRTFSVELLVLYSDW